MASQGYHGMPHQQIQSRKSEIPPDERADHVYARVVFSGNYGFPLCQNFQRFVRYNMTRREAEMEAWSAFGKCTYTIRFYDSRDGGRELGRYMVESLEPETFDESTDL